MAGEYIDNVSAGNVYTDALTVGPDFQSSKAIITVQDNDAFIQFAMGQLGAWRWTDEREYRSIPQSFSVGKIVGVRFRNAVAGSVARISCLLQTPDDPDFGLGMPFSLSGGNINGVTGSFDATGVPIAGTNYTVTRTAAGRYTVAFNTPLAAAPIVTVTIAGGAADATVGALNKTAGGFAIAVNNLSAVNVDRACDFVAIVPQ